MAITPKNMKILWASAAGRCAFPGCQCRLCTDDAGKSAPYTIGEMAHICGEKPGASRYDSTQAAADRDAYANLILLCPTHHTLVDKPENEKKYAVPVLQAMKSDHERYVNGRLDVRQFQEKHEVAAFAYPLLKENHDVFLAFGPQSEIARKNPESDAHGVWLSERLATIIPNNRKIAEIVLANSALFTKAEQPILTKFALHARTYESWVTDDVSYEGVVRFPEEFDKLISEMANGGHSDKYPWPPYYGHFRFFEQRMNAHSQVIKLLAHGGGLYELTNKYGETLSIFICECYSFGAAEYVETTGKLKKLDAIVINSAWCGYTTEAKRLARGDKVGLFKIGDFMSALNKGSVWEYLDAAENELFKKNGWL